MSQQDNASSQNPKQQLRMIWPVDKKTRLPIVLPDGYVLRGFRDEDADAYLALMHEAGFTDFNAESLDKMIKNLLPHGFFLIEYVPEHELAATTMANHQPIEKYPGAGAINWVAGAKKHSGRHLGQAAISAALNCLLSCGYDDIYLTTDDFRLPALKTYFKMGFVPDFDSGDNEMQKRWNEVFQKLGWR